MKEQKLIRIIILLMLIQHGGAMPVENDVFYLTCDIIE